MLYKCYIYLFYYLTSHLDFITTIIVKGIRLGLNLSSIVFLYLIVFITKCIDYILNKLNQQCFITKNRVCGE